MSYFLGVKMASLWSEEGITQGEKISTTFDFSALMS
jgi:hypothetical protein